MIRKEMLTGAVMPHGDTVNAMASRVSELERMLEEQRHEYEVKILEHIKNENALRDKVDELTDKVHMHDFFWEGCGLSRRGFKNTIAVSNYIYSLENKIKELSKGN